MSGEAKGRKGKLSNVGRRSRARGAKTPGVTLYQRRPGTWCAKWRDPDTGRWIQRDLAPDDARTAEDRTRYARWLSGSLRERRQDLSQGAAPKTGTKVEDLLHRYFAACTLRPTSLAAFTDAAAIFRGWCAAHGVKTGDEITAAVLAGFATYTRQRRKQVPVKGGRVGQYRETGEPRSAYSINRELGAMSAILNQLRKKQLLPMLTRDRIADALERMPVGGDRKGYLPAERCQELWLACDQSPIGDLVRVMLLTGMRRQEGLLLEWSEIDLDQRLIRMPASKTKTARCRLIDLDVSPSLLPLFGHLPRTGRYVFGHGGERPYGNLQWRIARLPFHGFHELRRTCSTFLCCMPSYGIYRAAERCGHTVDVAQRRYAGQVRIAPEVRTLEEAMGLKK